MVQFVLIGILCIPYNTASINADGTLLKQWL